MTPRERAALFLTAAGAGQLVLAGFGFAGWKGAAAVSGILCGVAGYVVGLEDESVVDDGPRA